LVVDLDVELDVAGIHTGDSNVDAVGLTSIRQFVLKPNAREDLLTRQLLSQSANNYSPSRQTAMDEVARRARVGRATLYKQTNAHRLKRGEAQSRGSAEPDWCDEMANAADTPLGELVDGLNEVAALTIPYERLPRRARTACAADFTYWGDIAGQTIESLLRRPRSENGQSRRCSPRPQTPSPGIGPLQ
jgi:hypothetical protein